MEWAGDHLRLLDQRQLPQREVWLELRTWEDVRDAISDMAVRGAPAIGVAAGYGMALAARSGSVAAAHAGLAAARPTAVNLAWALDRIAALGDAGFDRTLAEAQAIEREDLEMNLAIGHHGASLVPAGAKVLTICNTGSLATAGHGTALGVIRTAHEQGKIDYVWACETRPRQQGLRLTAWELARDGIPFSVVVDSAAGSLMRARQVDLVVVGADRIAANGDTANKIGTYSLAVLAHTHGLPFVVAAPSSTIDASLAEGGGIPIEERGAAEVTSAEGVFIAPEGCPVFNPGFDVTPAGLVTAIVTETGVHRPPYSFAVQG